MGRPQTEATKEKIGLANKGKPSAFKGRHHSLKVKQHLKEVALARGITGEKNPNFGHRWTEKQKAMMRAKKLEYSKTHPDPMLGKKHTRATRDKMSMLRRGKALKDRKSVV